MIPLTATSSRHSENLLQKLTEFHNDAGKRNPPRDHILRGAPVRGGQKPVSVYDILLGNRFMANRLHRGNEGLRTLAMGCAYQYSGASTREKGEISLHLLKAIKTSTGRFLCRDKNTGNFCEISDAKARNYVSQVLRSTCKELFITFDEHQAIPDVNCLFEPSEWRFDFTNDPLFHSDRKIDKPKTFDPRPCDVLCGQGGKTNHHQGNKKFRQVVKKFKDAYFRAGNKEEKSRIAKNVIEEFEKLSSESGVPGRFLKSSFSSGDKVWYQLTLDAVDAKTKQALREKKTNIR